MNLEQFQKTLEYDHPPEGLSDVLQALWWDGKGDWDRAHQMAQDIHSDNGAWVHAYLHRKEEDEWNAGYWYRQAGRTKNSLSLEQEWCDIVQHLL